MKKTLLFILMIVSFMSYSQTFEGQNFCEESKEYSHFPLEISKKKILWNDTFYIETKEETKEINGKIYVGFKQKWEKGNSYFIYFREQDGIIYRYDSRCEKETTMYDPKFKVGHTWKSADNENQYTLITYGGTLKTPFCEYQNVLVIEAKMTYGTYNFYYLRGHGYIGATQNGKLVSCVSPKW